MWQRMWRRPSPAGKRSVTVTVLPWSAAPKLGLRATLEISGADSPLYRKDDSAIRQQVASTVREAALSGQLVLPCAPTQSERDQLLRTFCHLLGEAFGCVIASPALGRIPLDGEAVPAGNEHLRLQPEFRARVRGSLCALRKYFFGLTPPTGKSYNEALDVLNEGYRRVGLYLRDTCPDGHDFIDLFADLPKLKVALGSLENAIARHAHGEMTDDALFEMLADSRDVLTTERPGLRR